MSSRDAIPPRALPRGEIERRVAEAVVEIGGKPAPSVDEQLSDHGFDSLALLELLALLEQRFRIELTEDVVSEFKTISRISRVVRDAEPR